MPFLFQYNSNDHSSSMINNSNSALVLGRCRRRTKRTDFCEKIGVVDPVFGPDFENNF